jgi:hypothetical protein
MKSEESNKPSATAGAGTVSTPISSDELAGVGVPIGRFAGTADIVVRIRNGKPIAANTGTQGGGQN